MARDFLTLLSEDELAQIQDLEHLVIYHPPTEEQKPLYAEVRRLETEMISLYQLCGNLRGERPSYRDVADLALEALVFLRLKVPPGADRSSAARHVARWRNLCNELLVKEEEFVFIRHMACHHVLSFRLEASSAIALGGASFR